MRLVVAHPATPCLVAGAGTVEQLEQNLKWFSAPIPSDFRTKLKPEWILREDAPTPRRYPSHIGKRGGVPRCAGSSFPNPCRQQSFGWRPSLAQVQPYALIRTRGRLCRTGIKLFHTGKIASLRSAWRNPSFLARPLDGINALQVRPGLDRPCRVSICFGADESRARQEEHGESRRADVASGVMCTDVQELDRGTSECMANSGGPDTINLTLREKVN